MKQEKINYKQIEKSKYKAIDLLGVTLGNRKFFASWPPFSHFTYLEHLKENMKYGYSHPRTNKTIYFREPTTAESLIILNHDRDIIKSEIKNYTAGGSNIDPDIILFALGRAVITPKGFFVNPPKNKQGKSIIDNKSLELYLNKCKKINGIWLYQGQDSKLRDFGFAPYESFETSEPNHTQESAKFVRGGLARVLEGSKEKKASLLEKISSKDNYPDGIYVPYNFSSEKNISIVIGLGCGASDYPNDNKIETLSIERYNLDCDRTSYYSSVFGILKE